MAIIFVFGIQADPIVHLAPPPTWRLDLSGCMEVDEEQLKVTLFYINLPESLTFTNVKHSNRVGPAWNAKRGGIKLFEFTNSNDMHEFCKKVMLGPTQLKMFSCWKRNTHDESNEGYFRGLQRIDHPIENILQDRDGMEMDTFIFYPNIFHSAVTYNCIRVMPGELTITFICMSSLDMEPFIRPAQSPMIVKRGSEMAKTTILNEHVDKYKSKEEVISVCNMILGTQIPSFFFKLPVYVWKRTKQETLSLSLSHGPFALLKYQE